MTKKFDSDKDEDELADQAYHAEFVRKIVKDHATGNPTLEPKLYDPDENGKCKCLYCTFKRV